MLLLQIKDGSSEIIAIEIFGLEHFNVCVYLCICVHVYVSMCVCVYLCTCVFLYMCIVYLCCV